MSIIPNIQNLIVCRSLLEDGIIKKFITLLKGNNHSDLKNALIYELIDKAESLNLSGNLLSSYIVYLMAQGKNITAVMTEKSQGTIGNSLYRAFINDMEIIYPLLKASPSTYFDTSLLDDYRSTLKCNNLSIIDLQDKVKTATNPKFLADTFIDYYRTYGFGDIANFRAFRWNDTKKLIGIRHFDKMSIDEIIGYEYQKSVLLANTEAFVNGRPANNALLVGARGTGKSSSVKALANKYFSHGLRLVEITKNQLVSLPQIMETLRQSSSKKFIIFLDDLSFEDFEVEYKYLKSNIEGGVESKPDNVLIYATSNRRHLIKETWKDRGAENDDIHRADTVNETISLSDRFGITISYLSPNQEEYLDIVLGLAKKYNLNISAEELRAGAIAWEVSHSGRSGRTAQQYINHLLGKN